MAKLRGVLLTGATGFLGRHLLRDLLLKGQPVAVLARHSQEKSAAERVAEMVASWSEVHHRDLQPPLVLAGELGRDGVGLAVSDRRWLGRHCQAVVHSAANLSFRETADGEPWRTNFAGTKALLALCREVGLTNWHHVSTAFVCGRRGGHITEEELDTGQSFHNAYEASKFEAEQLLRRTPGICATIYRPSVIVGDSRTGHTTSFMGFYRFLELAVRLAPANPSEGAAPLPLRLPLSGLETWNLVPVDWVSRAIVELLARPNWYGRTFHLVSRSPMSTRFIRDVAAEELNLHGVEFVGRKGVADASRLETLFLEGIHEYWPYLDGNPHFAFSNTAAALPHLPPPAIDRPLLKRLIRFAVATRWGRGAAPIQATNSGCSRASRCGEYIEQVFPRQARQSRLAREAGLDLTVGIDLHGPGGGQWSCKWTAGELIYARPGIDQRAAVVYRTDTATFEAVVNGLLSPQEGFFTQRIEIAGDLETALKLAVLFRQFLAEQPVTQGHRMEVMHSGSSQP